MAAKGVNLLPEDDDGQDKEELENDFDDDIDDLDSPPRRGEDDRSIIRIIGVVVAVVILLGVFAWAGYQFWWIPRVENEQRKLEARQRLEDLRKKQLEQAKAERERRKKELALLQKIRSEAEGSSVKKTETSTTGGTEEKSAGKETAGKRDVTASRQAPSERPGSPPKSPAPLPETVQPKTAKEMLPTPPRKEAAEKSTEKADTAVPAPVRVERKKVRAAPPRETRASSKNAKQPLPRMTPPRVEAREMTVAPKEPSPTPPSSVSTNTFYSVQVATCRTDKCARAFAKKLTSNGFRPRVSNPIPSSVQRTEVLLGEFPTKREALSLVTRARKKGVRTRLYRSKNGWRVSVGSFSNMEDAAQRLDQIEDAGFKAKLAAQRGIRKTRYRVVRTGKLSSRKAALALRRRVVQAGFPDSFIVIQRAYR